MWFLDGLRLNVVARGDEDLKLLLFSNFLLGSALRVLFRRFLEWADDESSAARLQRHMRPRVRRRQHSSSHSLGLGPSGRRSKELLSAQRSHSVGPTPRLRCAGVAHPRPDGSSGPPTHFLMQSALIRHPFADYPHGFRWRLGADQATLRILVGVP